MFSRPILFALMLAQLPLIRAAEPDPQVIELRETIAKIVDTQALSSAERHAWQARKEEMAQLLELHRREIVLLDEELEKAGQSAPGHDDRKQQAEKELLALKAARRAASEAVLRAAPKMLALTKRFPQPLAADCAADRANLAQWKPGDEPREALQAILGLISKAEQFNRRITRSHEVRDGREVEVFYLGLARAYYADRSGNAGVGQPNADGWDWQATPEIAREVRKAFDTLDKKRPPAHVSLPLEIH